MRAFSSDKKHISRSYRCYSSNGFPVPNWFVTHGSPNFCLNLAPGKCDYPADITMVSGVKAGSSQVLGEGIIGGYKFQAFKNYNIRIGVRSISNVRPWLL